MEKYLEHFFWEFDYPCEAAAFFKDAYSNIKQNSDAYKIFGTFIDQYEKDIIDKPYESIPELEKVAGLTGLNIYTVHFLYFVCQSRHLRYLYRDKGLSYRIYFDTMSDLKWKLWECKKLHNIWGTFVPTWFVEFFRLNRFALGRLQFEIISYYTEYEKDGHSVKPGDDVIAVHIPSCGPLLHDDCVASYKLAAEFFSSSFIDRPVVFTCHSWLMNPHHYEFLKPGSNILKFMDDYDLFESYEDENYSDLWRIFDVEYNGNLDSLPVRTSLQREYSDWFNSGKKMYSGNGAFFYKGEVFNK